jgi:basic membrane protein A and related proteins
MNRKLLAVVVLCTVVGFLVVACAAPVAPQPAPTQAPQAAPTEAPTAQPAKEVKACWVYSGVVNDQGWVSAQEVGRKYIETKFPNVKTSYVESVPSGADAERVIRQFADQGCNIIFTNSIQYSDAVEAVAAKYPNVTFEAYEGFNLKPNVRIHRVIDADSHYVAGVLAAKASKTGNLGFVATFPVADVVRIVDQFERGAQSVNPKATTKVVWLNSWYDPPKEKDAAESLMAAGADVIVHVAASPTILQATEAKGVPSIGANSQDAFNPKSGLGSTVYNWSAVYDRLVSSYLDGTWKPEDLWFGLPEDGVGMTKVRNQPADVQALVDQVTADIKSGKLDIWKGPIKDQQGVVKVPEGQTMSHDEMLKMDWLVQGVEGTTGK